MKREVNWVSPMHFKAEAEAVTVFGGQRDWKLWAQKYLDKLEVKDHLGN